MKHAMSALILAVTFATGALADHRCRAPLAYNSKGKVTARCTAWVTDKRQPGQHFRFQNCREHAITDSDCEWYERAPAERPRRGVKR